MTLSESQIADIQGRLDAAMDKPGYYASHSSITALRENAPTDISNLLHDLKEAREEARSLREALADIVRHFEKELSISGKYIRKPIYEKFEASLRRARQALGGQTNG